MGSTNPIIECTTMGSTNPTNKCTSAVGELLPVDLRCLTATSDRTAPTTGPRDGGRPNASRKWNAIKPANFLQGPNAWNWPNDQSLSMKDDTHR